jgi:hypothetical protein
MNSKKFTLDIELPREDKENPKSDTMPFDQEYPNELHMEQKSQKDDSAFDF